MNDILQQIATKGINFLFACLYLAVVLGVIVGGGMLLWPSSEPYVSHAPASEMAQVIASLERLETGGETGAIAAMVRGLKESQESSALAVGRDLQVKLEQEAMERVARLTDYDFRVMVATVAPYDAGGKDKLEDLQAGQRVMYLPQAKPQMLGESLLRYVMVAIPPYNKADIRWVPVDAVGKSESAAMKASRGWTKTETPEQIEWWYELIPGQQSPELVVTSPAKGNTSYQVFRPQGSEVLWSVNGSAWAKIPQDLPLVNLPVRVRFQIPPWAGPEVVRIKVN